MNSSPKETIVITGASSGIGRELAIQLAKAGRLIWILGRNQDRLEAVASEISSKGGEAKIAYFDLVEEDTTAKFLEKNFPVGTKVDQVYFAAAITSFGEMQDFLPEDWNHMYQLDLVSQIQMIHHFYTEMVKRRAGELIFVSSLSAHTGYPTAIPYATMKAGLLGLFRSLKYEAKPHGVAIRHAALGFVDTSIYENAIYRGTTYEQTKESIRSLGFKKLTASEAAEGILEGIRDGKTEIMLPGYARMLSWIAPRMPIVVSLIHRRMMNLYRKNS